MRNYQSNNIRLGIFVTVVLILFTVGVYKIGMKQNLFGSTFSISTIVGNANGLQAGNNVRYAGINVGSVEEINFVNDSTLEIVMILQERVQGVVKKDAIASIGSDGLVGNMIVNITPGKGAAAVVEEGDVLASTPRAKTKEMLDALDKSSENVAILTSNLLKITEKINHGTGTFSLLLNDDGTARNLTATVADFRKTSGRIADISKQLQSALVQVNAGEGLLGYLLKDTSLETHVNQLSYSLDSLINQRTATMMTNLEKSSEALRISTVSLQSKIDDLAFDQGLAGAIMADSTMVEDFKKIMLNLESGTEGFELLMEAARHNFLFRKYFKKLEKEAKKKS